MNLDKLDRIIKKEKWEEIKEFLNAIADTSRARFTIGVTPKDLKVAQHTDDYLDRSLRQYLEDRENAGQGDEYIFVIQIR